MLWITVISTFFNSKVKLLIIFLKEVYKLDHPVACLSSWLDSLIYSSNLSSANYFSSFRFFANFYLSILDMTYALLIIMQRLIPSMIISIGLEINPEVKYKSSCYNSRYWSPWNLYHYFFNETAFNLIIIDSKILEKVVFKN